MYMEKMMDEAISAPSAQDFEDCIGKIFQAEGSLPALTLSRIERYPLPGGAQASTSREPFSLIFHGQAGSILAEGLQSFVLKDGRAFEFHVMPIHTPVPGRQDYQAVFN
jgi:hypothetical protein